MNHQSNGGNTALLLASSRGHEDVVVNLLKHGKVDLNLQNNEVSTALMAASVHGHTRHCLAIVETQPF